MLVRHHETTSSDMSLSLFVGGAAAYMVNSEYGLMFSLAVGGIISGIAFLAMYLYSRHKSINSIPQLKSHPHHSNPRIRTVPNIDNKHMTDTDPEDLDENDEFYLGFCYKRGFVDLVEDGFISRHIMKKSPLKHSSIILVPLNIMIELETLPPEEHDQFLTQKKSILVCGRQSTIFRTASTIGFWQASRHEKAKTKIDNEGKYGQLGNAPFEPMMSDAIFSGNEIKIIIARIDELICNSDSQFCNMINSNCYSATLCMLATAIIALDEQHHANLHRLTGRIDIHLHPSAGMKAYQQINSLCFLLIEALSHNYGQGVLNNATVVSEVNKALKIADKFDHKASLDFISENLDNFEACTRRHSRFNT